MNSVDTLMILDPSSLYRTRFPAISAGYTTSSSMASCTAVRVRDRGLWAAEPFFGGLTIRLVAMTTTSCQQYKISSFYRTNTKGI